LSDNEVERMRSDAEAHAEEDRQRKALIEARNSADSAVYTAEKTMRDLGDKLPGDVKSRVEDEVANVRKLIDSDDAEAISQATDKLMQEVQQLGASAYQQTDTQYQTSPGDEPTDEQNPTDSTGDDDVVEGEFRNE
jgi:molecular chaperone DnaK